VFKLQLNVFVLANWLEKNDTFYDGNVVFAYLLKKNVSTAHPPICIHWVSDFGVNNI